MAAQNFHDLMRANEARNIRAVAEALAASAIERRETQGGAAHVRVDYPEADDENGRENLIEMDADVNAAEAAYYQSEAAVRAAQAQLDLLKAGPTSEEIAAAEANLKQAQAAGEPACLLVWAGSETIWG